MRERYQPFFEWLPETFKYYRLIGLFGPSTARRLVNKEIPEWLKQYHDTYERFIPSKNRIGINKLVSPNCRIIIYKNNFYSVDSECIHVWLLSALIVPLNMQQISSLQDLEGNIWKDVDKFGILCVEVLDGKLKYSDSYYSTIRLKLTKKIEAGDNGWDKVKAKLIKQYKLRDMMF